MQLYRHGLHDNLALWRSALAKYTIVAMYYSFGIAHLGLHC